MAWIVPPIYTDADAVADISADILGGDKVSRLYKSLVYEKQIAQDVAVVQPFLHARFGVHDPGNRRTQPHSGRDREGNRCPARDVPDDSAVTGRTEMGRSAPSSEALYFLWSPPAVLRTESIRTTITRRIQVSFSRIFNAIARPRPETIRDFAAQYLAKNSRVVVYGMPGEPDFGPPVPPSPKSTSSEGSRIRKSRRSLASKPAGSGAAARGSPFRTLESFQLANGLTVILDVRKGLPIVAANLVIRSGIASNPIDKPGLAAFMLDMLDEGTTTRSALGSSPSN